ncbi:MAG: cation transporter [Acidimicrobiales bacterium]
MDPASAADRRLRRLGVALEAATLAWNVAGVVVLAVLAVAARSVALVGFGLDSLIEIGASVVVLWELAGVAGERERRALRLIGVAFVTVSTYLAAQCAYDLATRGHARHSPGGIAWTAATAVVMLALAAGKTRVGRALGREALVREGRVTRVDAALAVAILVGLSLNALAGWWWADPVSALVVVAYGLREARELRASLRAGAPT